MKKKKKRVKTQQTRKTPRCACNILCMPTLVAVDRVQSVRMRAETRGMKADPQCAAKTSLH